MFNLIVSGRVENDRQGAIPAGRVLQYTEKEISERFMPLGTLDTDAIMKLPTLLMTEGKADEIVKIAWLSRVVKYGKDYQLTYNIDPNAPRLHNFDIYKLSVDLQLEEWEFSTNHWAIKDVDLFYVLLSQKSANQPIPTVFQLSQKPIVRNLISMMMPFSEGFSRAHQVVKSTLEAEGYECRRADNFWVNNHIIQDIIELICTSKVVICDLSGKNPNVFYEVGIAHTLGKEVILITQSMDDVPFDLKALRCITYHNNQEGCQNLASEISARLRTIAERSAN